MLLTEAQRGGGWEAAETMKFWKEIGLYWQISKILEGWLRLYCGFPPFCGQCISMCFCFVGLFWGLGVVLFVYFLRNKNKNCSWSIILSGQKISDLFLLDFFTVLQIFCYAFSFEIARGFLSIRSYSLFLQQWFSMYPKFSIGNYTRFLLLVIPIHISNLLLL